MIESPNERLEVRLTPIQMSRLEEISAHYGLNKSDMVRVLITYAEKARPEMLPGPPLLFDIASITRLNYLTLQMGRNINQIAAALNTIAKAIRESGFESCEVLDVREALDAVLLRTEGSRSLADELKSLCDTVFDTPFIYLVKGSCYARKP